MAGWIKIFSHDSSNGEFFNDYDDAKKKNENNPDASLYSILYQLENLRRSDGSFKFRICYQAGCNSWFQTSNPVTESVVTGFETQSLVFPIANGLGKKEGGVGETLICSDPMGQFVYYSIGVTRAIEKFGCCKFAGPLTNPVSDFSFISKVDLYVEKYDNM